MPELWFDGDCGFCESAVRILKQLFRPHVQFTPWQLRDVQSAGITEDDCDVAVQFVVGGRAVASGAQALGLVLLRSTLRRGRLTGRVLQIQPIAWLAEGIYRHVAKRRQSLGTTSCGGLRGGHLAHTYPVEEGSEC